MDYPFHHEPQFIGSPGNAIFSGEQVAAAVVRQPQAAQRMLTDAWAGARVWCKRPPRDVFEAMRNNHPGAVQAGMALVKCNAYGKAEKKFKLNRLVARGGHSFGFFFQSVRGALRASDFMAVMSCAVRGQAQVDSAWGIVQHPFAHLINVPQVDDAEQVLKVLNEHVYAHYANMLPHSTNPCFGRAIRNVGSWTFWSRLHTGTLDLDGLGLSIRRYEHPGYHDPVRMKVAAEVVRLFLNEHFDRSQTADVPMWSGMNGTWEEIGPNFGAIIDRASDEICNWIDWTVVAMQFADTGMTPPLRILALGLEEMTGRKDPLRAVSGGLRACGAWDTIAA